MDACDVISAIKTRLQDQQSKMRKDSEQIYRAELDALWAAVEVLAQLHGGQHTIVVPDWYSTNDKRLFPRVTLDSQS